jgi:hypothetical protein
MVPVIGQQHWVVRWMNEKRKWEVPYVFALRELSRGRVSREWPVGDWCIRGESLAYENAFSKSNDT